MQLASARTSRRLQQQLQRGQPRSAGQVSAHCAHHHGLRSAAPCPLQRSMRRSSLLVTRAADKDGKDAPTPASTKDKQAEYVEALKKGGIDQKTAKQVMQRWQEAGAEGDPSQLRKLFLKQSLAPITASAVQVLFDAGAAASLYMSAGFIALGPEFFGRVPLVYLLDFLSIYFAVCVFFDVVTLTSVLITTVKLGTSPLSFYNAVKAIAAPSGTSPSGLAVVEKAKAAVSSIKVAQALDAIAAMLAASAGGKAPRLGGSNGAGSGSGGELEAKPTKSIDTLTNLSAYLTLYRAEAQGGFDPSSVGMSEKEAGNIALAFGQYDLDDNGRLDGREFRQMLASLGADVSEAEADAAMEVMDANKDGYISFDEFAKWWATRKQRTPVSA